MGVTVGAGDRHPGAAAHCMCSLGELASSDSPYSHWPSGDGPVTVLKPLHTRQSGAVALSSRSTHPLRILAEPARPWVPPHPSWATLQS